MKSKHNYIIVEIATSKINKNYDMFTISSRKAFVDYFPIGSKKSAYNTPPPNNDGRDFCWWCGEETKTIQSITSQYNVCVKCGR